MSTFEERVEKFSKELRELMEKYNVDFVEMLEGDTHGIYDEGIGVKDGHSNQVVRLSDGLSLDRWDLLTEEEKEEIYRRS